MIRLLEDISESSLATLNDNDTVTLTINYREYTYQSDKYSAEDLCKKYNQIYKYSPGRAITWIKKNAHLVGKYIKGLLTESVFSGNAYREELDRIGANLVLSNMVNDRLWSKILITKDQLKDAGYKLIYTDYPTNDYQVWSNSKFTITIRWSSQALRIEYSDDN